MKKYFILILLISGMALQANAQFNAPDTKDLTQIKGKTLLVALVDENTRTLLEYQHKPDELKVYKDGIAKINEYIKSAFTKYYKFSKGVIEYMPEEKALRTMKGPTGNKYNLCQFRKDGGFNQKFFSDFYGKGDYTPEIRKASLAEGYSQMVISVMDTKKKLGEVYTIEMPAAYPSETDFIYAARMMNNQLKTLSTKHDFEIAEFRTEAIANNEMIKKKTILIDKSQLSDKTTEEDLKKGYPYNFEIVDYSKIQEAIKAEDTSYAYVLVIKSPILESVGGKSQNSIMDLVIDANTNKVIARAKVSRITAGKMATDITRKEMKAFQDPR